MSSDFRQIVAQYSEKNVSDEIAHDLGKAVAEPMDEKYKSFIQEMLKLIEAGTVDPQVPDTFVKKDVYEALPQDLKRRTDLAIVNIAHQLRLIIEFFKSTQTPNESPQLVTMIEQLWHMKEPIEKEADVFVF